MTQHPRKISYETHETGPSAWATGNKAQILEALIREEAHCPVDN